jgi:hypothetical protein
MKRWVALAVLAVAPAAWAQELKLSVFDRLKDKASDSTDLNLSKELIKMALPWLGDGDAEGAKVKRLAEGFNGLRIRSLEFEKEGVYTDADVQQLISELAGPGWILTVSADQKHKNGREISRIWVKASTAGELGGMRILSAEPKELSVIVMSGRFRPEDMKDLEEIGPNFGNGRGERPAKKKEEELY